MPEGCTCTAGPLTRMDSGDEGLNQKDPVVRRSICDSLPLLWGYRVSEQTLSDSPG
jgi:hypothetical protein